MGKYKSSTHKGKVGEEQLCSLLNSIYNTAEITNTTGQKASGDFLLKRLDKPVIMIEKQKNIITTFQKKKYPSLFVILIL